MKRFSWLFILLLVFLLFSACGKLSRIGTAPANVAPEVFLVNVPPDLVNFSTLAKIYWYGFDQDGYISKYQYLVIPDTGNFIPKSGGYIDPAFVQTIERVSPGDWNDSSLSRILGINRAVLHSVDSVKGNGTFDNIMLSASLDTTAYLAQYFFVRGVDNEGAVSKIWKPNSPKGSNFRLFTRTNRPPHTTAIYDTMLIEYCLPETTADWKGIKISWSAVDPDYSPRSQPAFSYSWQLLGPFDSKTSVDTTKVYYSSWDSKTGSPWVDSTSRLLVDLNNAPGKDYGWYQFRVRARDDAFVPDPNPAKATFMITKPPFLFSNYSRKSVLLVEPVNMYYGQFITPSFYPIRDFYTGLLQKLKDEGAIDTFSLYELAGYYEPYPPPETVFSQYKLVIFLNEGRFHSIAGDGFDTGFVQIERYLRVGGRVWMIGQNNFGIDVNLTRSTYFPISTGNARAAGLTQTAVRAANYYFGVTGALLPNFYSDTLQGRIEEMIAAESYDPAHTGLPRLEVDPAKLTKNYWEYFVPDRPPWDSLKGIPRAGYESILISNNVQRLYTAISYKDPALSLIHGRPCGTRAFSPNPWIFNDENGQHILQWRTAEFSFPGLPIKNTQMLEMMRVMVPWFMQDQYLP
ncbi:MAG: hypothetical protein A2W07_05990 [candidate division Zixibacteria bacterium RBG_16_43_9]|nr:MAG: hypothetical protein A2W07_05990 [candidate division Zixibacteria bacterium RBG_16_43_9]